MPNFTVADVPVQVSQTGTQEALIRNTGTVSVFLDAQSSVSSTNSGLELQPFDSVNWPTGQDLWAVCAPGTTSTITILYGASGVSLGAVTAVIAGTVDATVTGDVVVSSGTVNVGGILTPVVIQGGGASILTAAATLGSGVATVIPVVPPVSGQTYYAFRIDLQVTSAATAVDQIFKYTDTFGNQTYVVNPPTTATQVGIPQRHVFTIPAGAGSFNITLTNVGTGSAQFFIGVEGLNVSAPTPQTDMGILLCNQTIITVNPPTVAPESHVWFPPSFQPYNALLRTNSASGVVAILRQTYVGSAGAVAAYNTYTTRAWNVPGYPDASTLNNTTLGAVVSRFIPVTGNGQACRFEYAVNAANAGSVVMAILS